MHLLNPIFYLLHHYAILILIVLWQLFRAFGGPITEAENPWHLVVRGAIGKLLS